MLFPSRFLRPGLPPPTGRPMGTFVWRFSVMPFTYLHSALNGLDLDFFAFIFAGFLPTVFFACFFFIILSAYQNAP